jgi:hypothetical protein
MKLNKERMPTERYQRILGKRSFSSVSFFF